MSTLFDNVLRPAITAAARNNRIKETAQRLSVTERVVDRFVAGETEPEALTAIRDELSAGLAVTVDYLGEDTTDESQATATVEAYLALLQGMSELPAEPDRLEVSLKLTALGQSLPRHGRKIAEENAHTICAAARSAGVLVTVPSPPPVWVTFRV